MCIKYQNAVEEAVTRQSVFMIAFTEATIANGGGAGAGE